MCGKGSSSGYWGLIMMIVVMPELGSRNSLAVVGEAERRLRQVIDTMGSKEAV